MEDERYFQWLMFVTRELASRRSSPSNAGPRFHEENTFTIEDEGFSRWMGWRGEAEQERETAWPAEDLKQERLNRSYRKIWEENRDLKALLRHIRDEISKLVGT